MSAPSARDFYLRTSLNLTPSDIKGVRRQLGISLVHMMERAALPTFAEDWYCSCEHDGCPAADRCARRAQYMLDMMNGLDYMYDKKRYEQEYGETKHKPPLVSERMPEQIGNTKHDGRCSAFIDIALVKDKDVR